MEICSNRPRLTRTLAHAGAFSWPLFAYDMKLTTIKANEQEKGGLPLE